MGGNNTSYNNNSVIITIWRHIENPGIVRTVIQVFSGIFKVIKQYSGMFRHTERH